MNCQAAQTGGRSDRLLPDEGDVAALNLRERLTLSTGPQPHASSFRYSR
jgi:hypothetical protein